MAGEKKKPTDNVTKKTAGKTAGKAVSKPVKPASKPAGKAESKPAAKAVGKPATKAAGKPAGKTANKAISKPTAKTVSKSTPKATAKSTGKAAKAPGKGISPRQPVAKPAPRIDPQIFTANMEQALLGLKAAINDDLIAKDNDFKEIVEGTAKDLADIASDDIDRKILEAIGSQELKRLKLIESALTRIKQGKYGYCIKCGVEIPQERLEALPYALMCIKCKSEEERRNR